MHEHAYSFFGSVHDCTHGIQYIGYALTGVNSSSNQLQAMCLSKHHCSAGILYLILKFVYVSWRHALLSLMAQPYNSCFICHVACTVLRAQHQSDRLLHGPYAVFDGVSCAWCVLLNFATVLCHCAPLNLVMHNMHIMHTSATLSNGTCPIHYVRLGYHMAS